jgi:hypothetical protein
MTNNKITKTEYYSKLDKINLLDYMVDIKRNQNYFFYKGYKYALCSELINGKLTDTYYKWKR